MGISLTQSVYSWFSLSSTAAPSASSSSSLTSTITNSDESLDSFSASNSSHLDATSAADNEHPSDYGYGLPPASFAALLTTEYPSLHSSELVHLDHAASPPPPISAISSFTAALSTTLYSNPHSHSPTQRDVDRMRSRVMQALFGLGEREQEGWDLVWTSGTSASLKLIGEHFPWGPGARYRYLKESHTSLVGIRGCALAGGAGVESLDLDDFLSPCDEAGYLLHAYPAQCNVTGSRLGVHPAPILKRRENEAVLVDAAAYLSTSPLVLSDMPFEEAPDFVVGSFYKIYGHPTGLGFLLLKRSSAHFLTSSQSSRKPTYFGGGAIDALSVSSPYWVHPRGSKGARAGVVHERFENGTIPYLSIVALGCAMDAHQKLFTPRLPPTLSPLDDPTASLHAVSKHTDYLYHLLCMEIDALRHWDDTPVVEIHKGEGSQRWEEDGPTVSFSLYAPSSQGHRAIGHTHLLNLATLANIHLRTGGLCNTGVLARINGLSDRELEGLWKEGRVCGDGQEFGGDTGDKQLGLARISFGACSSVEDVYKFIEFLRRYFLISREVIEMSSVQSCSDNREVKVEDGGVYLQSLVRYPIKSCGGQPLTSSVLTPAGLLHDREFMLINSATGKTMSQKQFPLMVLIKPSIDDDVGDTMKVTAPGMPDLIVPMEETRKEVAQVRVCSDAEPSHRPSVEADEWFSKFLGVPCQLHRVSRPSSSSSSSSRLTSLPTPDNVPPAPILFSNESPYTLISTSSVDTVNSWIASDNTTDPSDSRPIHPSCFRANFTISSPVSSRLPSFQEDTLTHLRIGTQTLQVLARCRRCLMICVDQDTGVRMREPFCCLARHRRNGRRRVEFGVHLIWRGDLDGGKAGEARVRLGDRIGWTVG